MPDQPPLWSHAGINLRWRDRTLFAGAIYVGHSFREPWTHGPWRTRLMLSYGGKSAGEFSTEAEARTALEAAAVKALMGDAAMTNRPKYTPEPGDTADDQIAALERDVAWLEAANNRACEAIVPDPEDESQIERCARALCDKWMGDDDTFNPGRPHWMTYGKTRIDAVNAEWRNEIGNARAVLTALRGRMACDAG